MRGLFFILFLLILSGCGENTTEEPTDEVDILIASGSVLTTPEVTASAGAVLTIRNNDEVTHTVTSESAEGAFDNTGDFDVLISAGGIQVLTLPEAGAGTIFYYYCRLHEGAMTPADGIITID